MRSGIVHIISLLIFSTGLTKAQFVPAFSDNYLPLNEPCEVTALDGTLYKGTLKMAMQVNGKLKMLSIALDDVHERKRFTADDVTLVKMKPSDIQKIGEVANSATNVNKFKDIKNIIDCDWIYYEKVTLGENNRSYLMQRLNPGEANNKLKAYVDPNAKHESSFSFGGMTLAGGKDKSYFIVMEGVNKSVLAKKGEYKDQMAEIFPNCPYFFTDLNGDDDWGNFAYHVALYNHTCK